MKINTYILGLLAVAGLFSFQSCDDESYDVVGNPDNLIYFLRKASLIILQQLSKPLRWFLRLSDILVMKFTPSLEYLLLVPWMGVQR